MKKSLEFKSKRDERWKLQVRCCSEIEWSCVEVMLDVKDYRKNVWCSVIGCKEMKKWVGGRVKCKNNNRGVNTSHYEIILMERVAILCKMNRMTYKITVKKVIYTVWKISV